MKRFTFLALAAIASLSSLCRAQTSETLQGTPYPAKPIPVDASGTPYKGTPVPQGKIETPFSLDAQALDSKSLLQYRREEEMTPEDRSLVEKAAPWIRENAAMAGIEFDKANWSREQIVCQAMPDHLFLLFKGNNGAGDVSLFTAAIARSGNGRVRIIPIQRRGFALFSPAPVNELTVASFNRILADEPISKTSDWLGAGLCYAALTGAHPMVSPAAKDAANENLALQFPPTLEVGRFGESTVRFVDVASEKQPMQWAITFSGKGQLLKVEHFPTPTYAVNPAPLEKSAR
jgi:hypothetical protein